MENGSKDRRVRKTKRALQTALAKLLLEKKDLGRITVKELTDLADVNRGTFYLHYPDIFAFVEALENDIVESVGNALSRCDPRDTSRGLSPMLELLLRQMEASPPGMPLLTGSGNALPDKLFQLIRREYLLPWLGTYTQMDEERKSIYCAFLISGFYAAALEWLNTPAKRRISAEAMAGQLNRMALHGIDTVA